MTRIGTWPELRVLRWVTAQLPRLVVAVVAAVGTELAGVALIGTATWLIVRAAEQPPLAALTVAIVAVRALASVRGGLRYAERLAGHDAVLRALAELRSRVYAALVPRTPPSGGAAGHSRGDLLTRLVSDVDDVQDLLLRWLVPVAAATVVGAVAVGVTAVVVPVAGIVLAAGLLVAGGVLPAASAALTRQAARRTADTRGALAAATVDLLDGAADLAAYGASDAALRRANAATTALAARERAAAARAAAVTGAGVAVQGATVLAVAAVTAAVDQLPATAAPVLALVALSTVELVLPLSAAAARLPEIRTSVQRLVAVLDAPPAVPDPDDPAPPPRSPVHIHVRDLHVRHPGRPAALAGVDLRLPPGRRIAVVGPSGSGKSTLLAALVRFVPVAAGQVTINGIDITRYRGDDVRRVVAGGLADAHVFHTTIRENVAVARPDATDADIRAALARANLLTWVDDLPDGWHTVVGADGLRLSGGQRQRLLLARALLADPPVLLLDEPTEGLDPRAADAVLADIVAATSGRSVVLVTHRLSGLAAFDEVVVLDAGQVVQRGRFAELVTQPGYLRDQWRAQRLAEAVYPNVAPVQVRGVSGSSRMA